MLGFIWSTFGVQCAIIGLENDCRNDTESCVFWSVCIVCNCVFSFANLSILVFIVAFNICCSNRFKRTCFKRQCYITTVKSDKLRAGSLETSLSVRLDQQLAHERLVKTGLGPAVTTSRTNPTWRASLNRIYPVTRPLPERAYPHSLTLKNRTH